MFDRAIPDTDNTDHPISRHGHARDGLGIQILWSGPLETECVVEPLHGVTFGAESKVDQASLATLVERHALLTATNDCRLREATETGGTSNPLYVASSLEIHNQHPAAIDRPIRMRARMVAVAPRTTVLRCTVWSDGRPCAEATIAVDRITSDPQPGHVTRPPRQSLGGWSLAGPRV
jgi:hypothetical protein